MPGSDAETLLPIGDAARRLGVTVDTLRRWEKAGRISARRTVGKQRRFRLGDVEALLAVPEDAEVAS